MVNMMIYIRKMFFLFLVLAAPGGCYAVVNCGTSSSYPPLDEVVNLGGGKITVLEDIPVGTIVYQVRYYSSRFAGVYCKADSIDELRRIKVNSTLTYENTPLPLSPWHPAKGLVYETGVPGLGVAIGYTDKNPAPSYGVYDFSSVGTNNMHLGLKQILYLMIIKTGPVSPGTINATSLPRFIVRTEPTPGVTMSPFIVNRLSFTGQLNVTAPTCKTPDVTVNLGTHEISQKFKGKGSYTDWVSANIPFECPLYFYGYYPDNNTSLAITGGGTLPAGTPTRNQLTLTLEPLNEVIDAANGIMAVDKTEGAATGVGIQLNTPNNGWEDLPAEGNVDFNKPLLWSLINSRPVFWPLRARYIQTADKVTPGPANGKVVFTINYK